MKELDLHELSHEEVWDVVENFVLINSEELPLKIMITQDYISLPLGPETKEASGISTSSLDPHRNKGIVDGMGHYTQQLIEGLELTKIKCKGFTFPSKASRNFKVKGLITNDFFNFTYPQYMIGSNH